MIHLSKRRQKEARKGRAHVLSETGDLIERDDLPVVTTQVAVYNELNVVERILYADVPVFKKVQAFSHMTHYLMHPMMVTPAIPVLLTLKQSLAPLVFGVVAVGLAFSMMAPSALFLVSQQAAYTDWLKRMLCLPVLAALEIGPGLYCMYSLTVYWAAEKYLVEPFPALYATG